MRDRSVSKRLWASTKSAAGEEEVADVCKQGHRAGNLILFTQQADLGILHPQSTRSYLTCHTSVWLGERGEKEVVVVVLVVGGGDWMESSHIRTQTHIHPHITPMYTTGPAWLLIRDKSMKPNFLQILGKAKLGMKEKDWQQDDGGGGTGGLTCRPHCSGKRRGRDQICQRNPSCPAYSHRTASWPTPGVNKTTIWIKGILNSRFRMVVLGLFY